jgi:hypothetical protein
LTIGKAEQSKVKLKNKKKWEERLNLEKPVK